MRRPRKLHHKSGVLLLLLAVSLGAPALVWADGATSDEREKLEELNELTERLNELASKPALSEEELLLHKGASELLERARAAPAGSYLFDRLRWAIDSLLDASGELLRIKSPDDDEERDDRQVEAQRETARDLEQAYFRVQQGEYFGRQSGDPKAEEYIRLARRLYQQGRSAYDGGRYWRARRFAEAAGEVVGCLEGLAQASVDIPELPQL